MKRTLFAAVGLTMLLAACGGSQDARDKAERLENFTRGKGFNLDPRPSPSQSASEDEQDETPSDPNPPSSQTPNDPNPPTSTPSPATVSLTQLQRLVGGSPPVETAAAQNRRGRAMHSRFDSRLDTAIMFDYVNDLYQDALSYVHCSGTSCRHQFPNADWLNPITLDLSDPEYLIGETLLTRNGITIERNSYLDDDGDPVDVIGAILHNSWFASGHINLESVTYPLAIRYSSAVGDLTGSRPSVTGTWRGMATAVNKQNNDLWLGDAELEYSVSISGSGSMQATFGSFVNVSKGRAETPLAVYFQNFRVQSDGTFYDLHSSRYPRGNKIQGAFYGSDHAEAAGTFERDNVPTVSGDLVDLLGAFGTKRAR